MSRLHPLVLLCGALGCGSLSAYNLDPLDTDVIDDQDPVQITDIDPNYGSPEGGEEVTITGIGFEGDVTVSFGHAQVDFAQMGPGTLIVTTPYAGVEAAVDVTVESDLGKAVLAGGFSFSDDGPLDTGDTGDTGDPDPTGLVGGIVQFTRTQVACPDCFGYTDDLFVEAVAAGHAPSRAGWFDWMPQPGNCVIDPNSAAPVGSYQDLGEWVYLESGSANLPLRKSSTSAGPVYESSNLGLSDWVSNSGWTVRTTGGALGDYVVDNAMRTPGGFDSVEPIEMLYDDPFAFYAEVSQRGQTFFWSPSGGSGTFVVAIDVYSGLDGSFIGQIYCHGNDNGSMTVPAAAFSRYPAYSLLAVGLYRTSIVEAVIPPDGSTLQSMAQSGVLGTATLVP